MDKKEDYQTVVCCIVYHNFAQWFAHTYEPFWFSFRFSFLWIFCYF